MAALKDVRAGIFGQQKQLQAFFEVMEAALNAECAECARRREQTRQRVARSRLRAAEPAGKRGRKVTQPEAR